ncbi:MAG: DinB family protein [Roseiflexaceae bacterium]|nr:DinB family protein [Roseiflexaceae bacterium]
MVTVEYLRMLFAYQQLANTQLLNAAEGLSDVELDLHPIAAHDSIRETCVHLFSAEWMWCNRLNGVSPTAMLDPADFPSLESIRVRWQSETQALQQFIDRLSATDIEKPASYVRRGITYATPIWQILVHVAQHSTQHRSELAAMLTILGRSPGELDIIRYLRGEWE